MVTDTFLGLFRYQGSYPARQHTITHFELADHNPQVDDVSLNRAGNMMIGNGGYLRILFTRGPVKGDTEQVGVEAEG